MNCDFSYIPSLEGAPAEQAWLRERLETLTEREKISLSALESRSASTTAEDAINRICSLWRCMVYAASENYESLGRYELRTTDRKSVV